MSPADPTSKADLKKLVPGYTARSGRFDVVELPPMQYLMIDGAGDPNTSTEYADALATLYPAAYALKFLSKRQLGRDYTVPPLEARWWGGRHAHVHISPGQVGVAVDAHAARARLAHLRARGGRRSHRRGQRAPRSSMRSGSRPSTRGLVVQTLHLGPYDDEGPVLEAMHERVIPENGLRMTGRHHEIYPQRSPPHVSREVEDHSPSAGGTHLLTGSPEPGHPAEDHAQDGGG